MDEPEITDSPEQPEEPEKPKRGRPPNPPKPVVEVDRLEWLKFHPAYTILTPAQQTFVLKYIETGGDVRKTAKALYHPTSDKNANDMGMRYLRTFTIRRAIAAYQGLECQVTSEAPMTRAEFLNLLAARMRKTTLPDVLFAAYAKLLLAARTWRIEPRRKPGRPRKVEEPEPVRETDTDEFNIDDLVQQLEKEKRRLSD